jgi:hypothetical protein
LTDKNEDLKPTEWLLALLEANNAQPILGKTVFIKQLFVIGKELFTDIDKKFGFYPYNYGPYSLPFEQSLSNLIEDELVQVTFSEKELPNNGRYDYVLSPKGKIVAKQVFLKLSIESQRSITLYKRTLSKLGFFGLLNYVYSNYPEYAINSKLIKRGN